METWLPGFIESPLNLIVRGIGGSEEGLVHNVVTVARDDVGDDEFVRAMLGVSGVMRNRWLRASWRGLTPSLLQVFNLV
jgi:hypothetical protein